MDSNNQYNKKSYSVSKVINFVPINDNLVNFKTTFTLDSNGPFYMSIVDQDKLDNTPHEDLNFKHIQKTISGDVVYDKNIPSSYYLLLKSDIPAIVDVELNTEPIEAAVMEVKPSSNKNYMYILLVVVIVGVGYYLFTKHDFKKGLVPDLKTNSKLNKSLLERLQNIPV